ncbi:uncharacterized protein [Triticum aestivum]|uniref:uncharacterized protein n=1 Tax=Triticum aestivum TaxID=4565 RepID=UPI001D00DD78|nr:uncharacterized protein LOC123184622 [Triticum aestivum]
MTGGDGAAAATAGMENTRNEPARKGPKLRRPNDPPARYGPLEEELTVEINYSGFLCGFGAAKSYVDGKQARFDGCEADTWSPLWLTDFMEQLGYRDRDKYTLYWLLPGMDLGSGLRIIDRDVDTMHMIVVVPKFQYFQIFVDHKDMDFDDVVVIDDVVIGGAPSSRKYEQQVVASLQLGSNNIAMRMS